MSIASNIVSLATQIGASIKALTARVAALEVLPPYIFGDGSDGAVVLDGTVNVTWASKSGNVYLLSRDVFFTNLTVATNVVLATNGFRVFGTGKLTNSFWVGMNGNGASGATAGGIRGSCSYGGSGGGATGTAGLVGVVPATSTGTILGPGGGGGASAVSGGMAGGGVPNITIPAQIGNALSSFTIFPCFLTCLVPGTTTRVLGGVGGSSGGAASGGTSGGGGGGGACVGVFFREIVGAGTMVALGGGGGAAPVGNAGGGGGGCGGLICLVTRVPTSIATDVSGGIGGNGIGTGQKGGNGGAGRVFRIIM